MIVCMFLVVCLCSEKMFKYHEDILELRNKYLKDKIKLQKSLNGVIITIQNKQGEFLTYDDPMYIEYYMNIKNHDGILPVIWYKGKDNAIQPWKLYFERDCYCIYPEYTKEYALEYRKGNFFLTYFLYCIQEQYMNSLLISGEIVIQFIYNSSCLES